ncbi:MAG: hypothetical protein PF692_03655 [Kiritimatiellae bacterium]|jgi:hypothetical protein|nr:hypothetical protein [Kiritimatiellia bacterium]
MKNVKTIKKDNFSSIGHKDYKFYLIGTIILTGVVAISFTNFLLFHTLAEIFSVLTACSIFIVSWNTRKISSNNYLIFLGIMYLFVGMLDLTHTLAYKGMNIFVGYGANLPTQLWIGTRYIESVSLAIAPIFFTRRLSTHWAFGIYLGLCTLLFATLFVRPIFPDCFIDGSGLTAFKKNSEYIICLILCIAVFILYLKRAYLDKSTFKLVVFSLVLTIISEMAFTFYISVYGISNIVGHIFKILSFYMIYQAVIVATLRNPYKNLFGEVVESEKAKEEVINELQKALKQVKQLQGFLPICASCKQIRDDKGYWNQIEEYISEHSEAKFSHGLCPKCAQKLYPDIDFETDNE